MKYEIVLDNGTGAQLPISSLNHLAHALRCGSPRAYAGTLDAFLGRSLVQQWEIHGDEFLDLRLAWSTLIVRIHTPAGLAEMKMGDKIEARVYAGLGTAAGPVLRRSLEAARRLAAELETAVADVEK